MPCYLFYVFVTGYEFRRLVCLVICFMYLFQDTSSGDLYALLFVICIVLGYELRKFVSLVDCWIVYGLGIV